MIILPPIGGADDGETQRDAARNRLRACRATLIRDLTRAALCVAMERGELIDGVRAVVPIPADISPKFVGAMFRDPAFARVVRRAGFRNSTRPEKHARPLSDWQLAAAAAVTPLGAPEGNQ